MRIDPNRSNMLSFKCLLKKLIININFSLIIRFVFETKSHQIDSHMVYFFLTCMWIDKLTQADMNRPNMLSS